MNNDLRTEFLTDVNSEIDRPEPDHLGFAYFGEYGYKRHAPAACHF